MKLSTVAVFTAGYVLGTRAGRERFEQISTLAGRLREALEATGPQERIESYASRLEAYATRNGGIGAPSQSERPAGTG